MPAVGRPWPSDDDDGDDGHDNDSDDNDDEYDDDALKVDCDHFD